MSYHLSVSPAANRDVHSTANFIAEQSPLAARRFYEAVVKTYAVILEAPLRWPIYEVKSKRLAPLRKRSVAGFSKILIFYRTVGTNILVVRVLHGARDLGRILDQEA